MKKILGLLVAFTFCLNTSTSFGAEKEPKVKIESASPDPSGPPIIVIKPDDKPGPDKGSKNPPPKK